MILFDLDSLTRDSQQNNLYDLFEPTFKSFPGYQQNVFVVDRDCEMRIDIVCNKILDSVNILDGILHLNDIDNPLNIMENDTIYFTSVQALNDFKLNEIDKKEVRNQLTNPNKATKKDKNREKYIEDNFSLPPTVLPEPKSSISFEGDKIVLGL
jgi:hypothetical protein